MEQKKKIAVLLHGLGANGIDSLFANLAEQWNQEILDITYFIAVDEDNKQFWEDRVKKSGVKIVKLHDLDKGRLKRFPITLYQALKRYGPFDVIHVNMDLLSGICVFISKILGIRTRIVHAHKGNSVDANSIFRHFLKKIYIYI